MNTIKHLIIAALFALASTGAFAAGKLDINSASAAEIAAAMNGIGLAKAEAIVAYREQHGPFASLDALDDVPGIGAATLAGLRTAATTGGAAPTAPPRPPPGDGPAQAPVATTTGAIDVNTASLTDLQQLPGIGATKAEAIVQDRETNGPFASCQDLTRVAGIGPATVAAMGERCSAGE